MDALRRVMTHRMTAFGNRLPVGKNVYPELSLLYPRGGRFAFEETAADPGRWFKGRDLAASMERLASHLATDYGHAAIAAMETPGFTGLLMVLPVTQIFGSRVVPERAVDLEIMAAAVMLDGRFEYAAYAPFTGVREFSGDSNQLLPPFQADTLMQILLLYADLIEAPLSPAAAVMAARMRKMEADGNARFGNNGRIPSMLLLHRGSGVAIDTGSQPLL